MVKRFSDGTYALLDSKGQILVSLNNDSGLPFSVLYDVEKYAKIHNISVKQALLTRFSHIAFK